MPRHNFLFPITISLYNRQNHFFNKLFTPSKIDNHKYHFYSIWLNPLWQNIMTKVDYSLIDFHQLTHTTQPNRLRARLLLQLLSLTNTFHIKKIISTIKWGSPIIIITIIFQLLLLLLLYLLLHYFNIIYYHHH